MRCLNARLSCSNHDIWVHHSQVEPPTAARGVPGVSRAGGGHPRGPPVGAERRGRWRGRVGATGSPHRKGHRRGLSGVIATVNLVLVATAGRPISIDISALLASSNILPRPQSFTVARIKPCTGGRRRSRASRSCEPPHPHHILQPRSYFVVWTWLFSSHLISSFYLIVSHLI
jgi:hypothetical protein